jgi:hypothetical protein
MNNGQKYLYIMVKVPLADPLPRYLVACNGTIIECLSYCLFILVRRSIPLCHRYCFSMPH